jgi:hypothetical protein
MTAVEARGGRIDPGVGPPSEPADSPSTVEDRDSLDDTTPAEDRFDDA